MRGPIDFFLNNRWLVLVGLILLLVGGITVMLHLPLEAFPDLTNNQVVVTVQCPGMSPVEVEQLVTFPLETTMLGMPKLQIVRSTSKLELSMLTVIFDDTLNPYLARQLVAERLNEAQTSLPAGLQPQLGPMATAFGEVYQYTVQAPKMTLMQIKSLHDWVVRYALMSISGVSEINSWGGDTKQYTVVVDPDGLRRYNLTLHDVIMAVENNNVNFGGSYIEHAGQMYTVRGVGRATSLDDLGKIVVMAHSGVPVLLNQVAKLELMPLLRHGAVLRDGKGESVSGMVIILKGTNGQKIIQQVKQKIGALKLPNGAKILPFYDQSEVIDVTIRTVKKNLIEAAVLVIAILLVFLGDWRAALIVAATIPLALLFAFLGMELFGISANLMSLGAIDFGTLVDGSVVMVENCVHRLDLARREGKSQDMLSMVRDAAHEVSRPVTFGVLIILAVYIPVLTLQDLAGRMFRPMAVTVMSALTGSLVLALLVVPTLCTVALVHQTRRRKGEPSQELADEKKAGWFDRLRGRYERSLGRVERFRKVIVASAAVLVFIALGSLKFIGTEFMPTLDEGSLIVTSKKLPGISLNQSIEIQDKIEAIIRSFPEVTSVVSKMGRPDLATEAMGVYEADAYISYAPPNSWKCCKTKAELSDKLQKALSVVPGVTYEFTQPMQMRMDETITGTRGDAALKIFGDDLDTLEKLGHQALIVIGSVQGASEPQMERILGSQDLEINVDRLKAARYGLNVSDVQEVVESLLGSKRLSEMVTGEQRYPIAVRLPSEMRNDLDSIYALQLKAPDGALVRLDQVAEIRSVQGPILINRENAHRRVVVMTDVNGRDLGSFVKEAQQKVESQLPLPPGYHFEWGGQFENEKHAEQRLALVLPLSLMIISGLLFATFQNIKQTLLILGIVPLALVGGVAALWIRGLNLNLSASVGFIALFGVAVLNGVVMVSHINQLRADGLEMDEAVRRGAVDRLRPVLITALVASLGFIPMATATSRGAEVQRPLATVVIGGLVTATMLTLYILPLLYPWFSKHLDFKAKTS